MTPVPLVRAVCVGGVLAIGILASAPDAAAAERAPAVAAGKNKSWEEIHEWTSKGGVTCSWRGPREVADADAGVNLTIILHGSNLTHGWGFANHGAASFRPDDLVLSPDGISPNGNGGFNFLEGDARKAHALLEEVKGLVNVRSVFLYGHSQGSFFALTWAGEFPEEIQGVVAHASGIWRSSRRGKKGHEQAIVFQHGTQDPVVPYGQSVGGFEALRDAGYPLLRLRSLEWWNHWPAEHNGPVPHTSQQLAWVEGMTTADPARLEACLDVLAEPAAGQMGQHDFAGLWSLAGHVAAHDAAPEKLRKRAGKLRERVEKLAAAHVDALQLPAKVELEKKPWVGHLPVFLRAFQGLPACDELAAAQEDLLALHQKDAVAHLKKHYAALKPGKEAKAFEEGVAAIETGFLWRECWNIDFRNRLREWRQEAKDLGLGKKAVRAYDALFDDFEKAVISGSEEFEKINRKW